MSKIYEKYRDLITNPFDIKYKNIEIKEIISYPPAGNDVVECLCKIGKDARNVFIKIERSKVCDFATEIKNLNYLKIIVIIQKYQTYMKVAFIIINNI